MSFSQIGILCTLWCYSLAANPHAEDAVISEDGTVSMNADDDHMRRSGAAAQLTALETDIDSEGALQSVIRRQAAKQLPADRVGLEAAQAEKKMIDAVRKENSGSTSAEAASDAMVKAALEKVSATIDEAQQKISSVYSQTTKALAKKKAEADAAVHSAVQIETAAQAKTRASTEAVETHLKTASTQEQMIKAAADSENAAALTSTRAQKVEEELKEMTVRMAEMVDASRSMTKNSAEEIERVIRSAKTSSAAIAEQLSESGSQASARINAKESASLIAKKTSDAAADITSQIEKFVTSNSKLGDELQASGEDVGRQIDALQREEYKKGILVAQRLNDGAEKAKSALISARGVWIKADVNAMKDVEQGTAYDGRAVQANAAESTTIEPIAAVPISDQEFPKEEQKKKQQQVEHVQKQQQKQQPQEQQPQQVIQTGVAQAQVFDRSSQPFDESSYFSLFAFLGILLMGLIVLLLITLIAICSSKSAN